MFVESCKRVIEISTLRKQLVYQVIILMDRGVSTRTQGYENKNLLSCYSIRLFPQLPTFELVLEPSEGVLYKNIEGGNPYSSKLNELRD